MTAINNEKKPNKNDINKKPTANDPRKHPSPGYDEKNPNTTKDIYDKPKNQRPG